MDGLTSHTIPQSEPSLPLCPMRGIQVQAAYNLMFPQRLPMSSAPPHTLSRFHFINKWFFPATPQAKLSRAGVITGMGGVLKEESKQQSEWLERKRRKIKQTVENALHSVSMATPSLSGPFVLVSNSLQTALTSKWPHIDIWCQLRCRETASRMSQAAPSTPSVVR